MFPNTPISGTSFLLDGGSAEAVAIVCYEANRAFCAYNGDLSQKPWDEAEQWQRDSAIAGVNFLFINATASDSALHNNWSKDKIADGWVYGEVKDPVAKTHPCLVPFDQLPADQQFKDKLFRAVCVAAFTSLPLIYNDSVAQ